MGAVFHVHIAFSCYTVMEILVIHYSQMSISLEGFDCSHNPYNFVLTTYHVVSNYGLSVYFFQAIFN